MCNTHIFNWKLFVTKLNVPILPNICHRIDRVSQWSCKIIVKQ